MLYFNVFYLVDVHTSRPVHCSGEHLNIVHIVFYPGRKVDVHTPPPVNAVLQTWYTLCPAQVDV